MKCYRSLSWYKQGSFVTGVLSTASDGSSCRLENATSHHILPTWKVSTSDVLHFPKYCLTKRSVTKQSPGPAVFHGTQIFTPRCRIRRLPQKNAGLPVLGYIYIQFKVFPTHNFTIYTTIKFSGCRLQYCALAHSSKLDTG